jgi:hypothetical protein
MLNSKAENPSVPPLIHPGNMGDMQLTSDKLRVMAQCCAAATGTL